MGKRDIAGYSVSDRFNLEAMQKGCTKSGYGLKPELFELAKQLVAKLPENLPVQPHCYIAIGQEFTMYFKGADYWIGMSLHDSPRVGCVRVSTEHNGPMSSIRGEGCFINGEYDPKAIKWLMALKAAPATGKEE